MLCVIKGARIQDRGPMAGKTELHHGKREVRLEDDALVRGAGRFVDDARFPNQAFAVFVRSPHAHAKVISVDTAQAAQAKGVLAVMTGADMKAAGLGTAGKHPPLKGRGGKDLIQPFRPGLPLDRVRYVGEAVAMVVAETVGQAQDGADLVQVGYENLRALVATLDAMKSGSVQLHSEAPANTAIDWPVVAESADNEREVDAII